MMVRLAALALVALALMLLGADLLRSLEFGSIAGRSMGSALALLPGLDSAAIDPLGNRGEFGSTIYTVLRIPAWLVLGGAGLVVLFVFGPRD